MLKTKCLKQNVYNKMFINNVYKKMFIKKCLQQNVYNKMFITKMFITLLFWFAVARDKI